MLPDSIHDTPPCGTRGGASHTPRRRVWPPRAIAALEVLLCSDYPTQFALASTLAAFGVGAFDRHGQLRVSYVVGLSLGDTVLLLGLVLLFIRAHGERAGDVFLGRRPVLEEILRGLPLTFAALLIGAMVLLAIQRFAPSLHTVAHNPLQDLVTTRARAWLFGLVVIVAGGLREELQRAFLLHRFEQSLGGGALGVLITSAAFGGGHLLQGVDAAIATGLLGAFWGFVYLRRRSAVASIVSHSGFDLLQIVQYVTLAR